MKMNIERVWGMATVSGGGHVVKTERGVIHMVPCDLPAATVRLTVMSNLGGTVELFLTMEQAGELIHDLKAVAYDG